MQFIEPSMRNSARVDLKGSWEYKQTDDPFLLGALKSDN